MLSTSTKQTLSRAFCLSATLVCLGASNGAWALLSDDEARKAILDLRKTLATTQLELQGQIEKLKADNADLRGKIEDLQKQGEDINSSQKTYYQDLDTRLGSLEPRSITIEGVSGIVQPDEKKVYDTMCDQQIIDWCALPPTMAMVRAGRNHYKTPNLTELYTKCFDKKFSNAHSALADCRAVLEIVSHTSKLFAKQA